MLSSMTGFARVNQTTDRYQIVWECRSVNHRYLEISLRLPEGFVELESMCREHIQSKLTRGKIVCELSLIPVSTQQKNFEVDQGMVLGLLDAAKKIQELAGLNAPLNLKDILKWPGVIKEAGIDAEAMKVQILELLDRGLKELTQHRQREGQKLQAVLTERLHQIEQACQSIKDSLPAIHAQLKERLTNKLKEVKTTIDESRFEQELVLYLNKMDIQEELDRLSAHISETQEIFKQGGAVGRRLDFLMQEFNREANTVSSKSVGITTTQSAVSMKVWIEQMREQVQNIE